MSESLNKKNAREYLLKLLNEDEKIRASIREIVSTKADEIPKGSEDSAEIFEGAQDRPNEGTYNDLVNLDGWRHYDDNFEPVNSDASVELKTNPDADTRIKELEDELEKMRIEVSNLREKNEQLSKERDGWKNECEGWKNECEGHRRECEGLKAELDRIRGGYIPNESDDLKMLRGEIETLISENARLKNDLATEKKIPEEEINDLIL